MAEMLVAYTSIKIILENSIERGGKKLLVQNHPVINENEFSAVPELNVEVEFLSFPD